MSCNPFWFVHRMLFGEPPDLTYHIRPGDPNYWSNNLDEPAWVTVWCPKAHKSVTYDWHNSFLDMDTGEVCNKRGDAIYEMYRSDGQKDLHPHVHDPFSSTWSSHPHSPQWMNEHGMDKDGRPLPASHPVMKSKNSWSRRSWK